MENKKRSRLNPFRWMATWLSLILSVMFLYSTINELGFVGEGEALTLLGWGLASILLLALIVMCIHALRATQSYKVPKETVSQPTRFIAYYVTPIMGIVITWFVIVIAAIFIRGDDKAVSKNRRR